MVISLCIYISVCIYIAYITDCQYTTYIVVLEFYLHTVHLAIVKTCANCGNKSHSRTKKCNCGAEFKAKSAKEHAKEVKHPSKTWNLLQRKVHTQ